MKHFIKSIVCIFLTFFLALNLFAETTMYISSKQVQLREKATALSKKTGVLSFSTVVTVLETKGNWSKIQEIEEPFLIGWVKSSNLTKKKISALSIASTNADELALAGKGSINSLSVPESEDDDSLLENESETVDEVDEVDKADENGEEIETEVQNESEVDSEISSETDNISDNQ